MNKQPEAAYNAFLMLSNDVIINETVPSYGTPEGCQGINMFSHAMTIECLRTHQEEIFAVFVDSDLTAHLGQKLR
jgi:hypothetical protein